MTLDMIDVDDQTMGAFAVFISSGAPRAGPEGELRKITHDNATQLLGLAQ